jgi:predicted Na+-dependent transporter
VLFGPQKVAVPAAVFMIIMVLGYIAFGPLYMRRAMKRAPEDEFPCNPDDSASS